MMDKESPEQVMALALCGYARAVDVSPAEIAALFPLAMTRVVVSVLTSADRIRTNPENAEYLDVHGPKGWRLLAKFRDADIVEITSMLSKAVEIGVAGRQVEGLTRSIGTVVSAAPLPLPIPVLNLPNARPVVMDLSQVLKHKTEDTEPKQGPTSFSHCLVRAFGADKDAVAVGRYNELRKVYDGGDQFVDWFGAKRNVHVGVDFFVDAGVEVLSAFDGVVHSFRDNDLPLDYGPCIILKHQQGGLEFHTLYGHLSRESLVGLSEGQAFSRGQKIGTIGAWEENGGWRPHLHFQAMTSTLGMAGDFPGVCSETFRGPLTRMVFDPQPLLGFQVTQPDPVTA